MFVPRKIMEDLEFRRDVGMFPGLGPGLGPGASDELGSYADMEGVRSVFYK